MSPRPTPVSRDPRALRPVENRPTTKEHARAGGLGVVVFAANTRRAPPHAVGRGSSSPTPRQVGGCGFERRNTASIACRATRARFAPWRTSRPPTEHAGAGGLGVVVFAANARRARSHAVGQVSSPPTLRQVDGCGFRTSMSLRPTTVSRDPRALRPVENQPMTKGARARWRTWRVVLAAHARRAPSHAVGRVSSSPTPCQFDGCGFETSLPPRPTLVCARPACASPRGEQADDQGSTRALADLAWLSLRPTRDTLHPHAVGRGSSSPTPRLGRRLQLRDVDHCNRLPCRATRARFAPWRTSRPPTEHAGAGGLGVVVFAANARRARSHAVGQVSSPPTLRQVDGCGFRTSCHCVRLPCRATRVRCALWRTSRSTKGARARWRTWRGCLCGQHATRSTPTPLAEALLHRHRARSAAAASRRVNHCNRLQCRATRARFAPWRTSRPPTERAGAGGLGVVVFAANARRARSHAVGRVSSPPTLRQVDGCGFRTSMSLRPTTVSRDPRALRPVENQPMTKGARARWRTWRLSSQPTRDALHPTPLAEALLHRHRARSAAAASKRVDHVSKSRGARPARASPRGEPADRPRSTRALADLAWLSSRPTRDALHPTPLAEALLHRHRARSAAAASKRRDHCVRIPWRAARARFALWRTSRPPTEHARAGGLGVVVFAANTRHAPPHAVGRGSSSPTPRLGRRLQLRDVVNHCNRLQCRATRARFAPWRTSRPPTEHAGAGGLGVVVFAANARRARSHAVGQVSSPPTLRQVDGCGFRTSMSLRPTTVSRDPRALRPVENQPMTKGARARWRTWRVVLAANARRAPSHAVGRGSSSPTPRQFDGCGFETSLPPRPTLVSRDPRALRPVENRPMTKGARARWRTWRGCLCGQHATRSTPTPLVEALLHRHRPRSAAAALRRVDHCNRLPCRATRARFAPWRTGRPPTEHAGAGGLGVVVFAANARRARSHAVGRDSSSPTPRQVDGCGFETSLPLRPTTVSRDPRALRPVENQPMTKGARGRWRTWRVVLAGQRATRSISRRWPRLFFTDTAPVRRLRLRNVVASASDSRVRATRVRFAPWRTGR